MNGVFCRWMRQINQADRGSVFFPSGVELLRGYWIRNKAGEQQLQAKV